MPELAEVEFFRRRWYEAAEGQTVRQVSVHRGKRLFRDGVDCVLKNELRGRVLHRSDAAGKQMLFQFGSDGWLGVHLGMAGELSVRPAAHNPGPHDHLVIGFDRCALVLTDPRMFGAIRYARASSPPRWWADIAPAVLSKQFTRVAVQEFLCRRRGAPIKSVLLMQERFPGIGNWMADEILWRAAIHPARPAGSLSPEETGRLWKECRRVCRLALQKIAGEGGPLPPDLNVNIPETWLFHHRWRDGGRCPLTGAALQRTVIGGRTTCWSPTRQPTAGRRQVKEKASR